MNPCVIVHLNMGWLHQILQRLLERQVSTSATHEISRETVIILESALTAGQSVSVGNAIAEALDLLGYMNVPINVDVTGVL